MEGLPLPVALEGDPGQGLLPVLGVGGQILRGDRHHQAAVGIALPAGVLAHAVGDDAALFGGGPHHQAAGTHAEAVDAAAGTGFAVAVVDQLVLGGAQPRMAGRLPPAGPVDQGLGMLDPHPDRKGLRLHGHAEAVQHREGVPGAVARRQDQMVAGDGRAVGQPHARQAPLGSVPQQQLDHVLTETDLAPQGLDPGPQPAHHRGQLEGADVGVVQGEDLRIGPGRHQLLQHLADVGGVLAHLAVELAVGEGAGAPLAELGIGAGIEAAAALPEAEGVRGALLDRLAALQQQRPPAHLGQQQGGEVATGAGTHHHRAQLRGGPLGPGHGAVAAVRGRTQVGVAGVAAQQAAPGSILELQVEAVHQGDGAAPPGIDAALHQVVATQFTGGEPQPAGDGHLQVGGAVVERQFQLAEAQHGRGSWRAAGVLGHGGAGANAPDGGQRLWRPRPIRRGRCHGGT